MEPNSFKTSYTSTDDATQWYVIGGTIDDNGSGNYTISTDKKRSDNSDKGKGVWTSNSSNSAFIVTPKMTGNVTIYFGRYSKYAGSVEIYEATESESTFTKGSTLLADKITYSKVSSATTSFMSTTVSLGSEGKRLAIVMNRACMDDFSGTLYEQVDGPALTVKDGSKSINSPYAFNFGLATAGTTHEFTLSNPGTAAVEVGVSETGNFGATLSATSIAAGETATLTVTMPEVTSSSEITISSTTEGIAPFVINASGTIRDASKLYEYGFTALPTDWTTNGSWYYSETNGAYTTTWYPSDNYRLITPLLTVEEGETFFVEAKGYSTSNTSYQHLQMQYSADGSTWTNFDSEPTLDPSNWNTFTFTGVPAGSYYIAINASQADIRMFYGGKLPVGAKFDINTDGTTQDFGFVAKNATAEKTFTVTNSGNAALNVSFAATGNFAVTAPAPIRKFKLTDNLGWGTGKVYAWDSEGNALLGEWPGTKCEKTTNGMSETQFVVTVPNNAVGIIVNNGSGAQTEDITNFNQGYWMDGTQNALGHYVVTGWTGDGATEETPAVLTVAAGESADFTVAMNTATPGSKSGNVTLSFDALNATSFTIPASGYVADDTKFYEDFSGNALPSGWSTTGWTFSDNAAKGAWKSGDMYQLITPALTVSGTSDVMAIRAKKTASSATLPIYVSKNGGNYTLSKTISNEELSQTEYGLYTLTGLEAGSYKIRFDANDTQIDIVNGFVLNANAPELTVDPTTAADFGKVKAQPAAKTYTITNSGTGTLTGEITSSDTDKFTVSQSSFSLGAGENMTFDVNLVFDANYGEKAAAITVHPTNDGLDDVVINATATTIDPNVWTEDFDGGSLPIGWTQGTWTIGKNNDYENKTTMALAPSGSTAGKIITPCLTAKAGDVLTWDGYFNWYDEAMTVEYSNDSQETWTKIYDAYEARSEFGNTRYTHKEMSFTAPADGDYYLRFTSTYLNGVDNFCGFKLNLPDHIMAITASNIPTSGSYSPSMKATKSFNATVTVAESRGVAETGVVAKLYMGSTVIGTSDPVDFEANESKPITIECTPAEAATEGVEMHIEVEYAGGTLSTTPETRYVAELVRLDMTEGSVSEITTGYSAVYDLVTLTRNFVNGWNTFVAPCEVKITDIHADAIAYSFTNFAGGALQFNKVTSTTLTPATPYIIYVPEQLDNKVLSWESPVIYSSYVGEENVKTTHGDVTFQGTYAPIAAGGLVGKYGVTADGRIAPASSIASLKGFRAYFSGVPAGARIALFGEDDVPTGIRFIDGGVERSAEGVYNLNGQRVQNVKKGLYIQNGRKVVIK